MYDLVFFYSSINRAGSELALLRYLKKTQKKYNIALVYYKDTSDNNMLDEFKKIIEVKKINEDEVVKAKVGVNCMISTTGSGFFDKVNADKYILWVQVNPEIYSNYKDFDKYHSFLTTSQYIKDIVLKYPNINNKTVYLANPVVDVDEIRIKANEKQNVLNDNELNLITLARISNEKGYDYIIEIARRLKLRKISFKWYMLGFVSKKEEEYYHNILKRIKEYNLTQNIIFMGAHENPYKYLKHAHINILLSKNEAWGLAVTEAKILAIPSIVSNNSALKEQIKDNFSGFLVDLPNDEQDYEKITDKIHNLIKDKDLYNKIVQNLKKFKFCEKNIIEETDKCFFSSLEKKS